MSQKGLRIAVQTTILILVSHSVFAATEGGVGKETTTSQIDDLNLTEETPWVVEANMMLRSQNSTLVGPSVSYRAFSNHSFGFKTLMSTSTFSSSDEKVMDEYVCQAFSRHVLSEGKTEAYLEPVFGLGIQQSRIALNAGLGFGVSHQLTREFSVGGISGVDLTTESFRRSENRFAASHISPRIALLAGFHF